MTAALRDQIARCLPWLEPALRHGGEHGTAHLVSELLANRAQLWPGESCAIVTQCTLTSRGPAIHAWLGGGILSEMVSMRPGIEAFGRAQGAAWATIEGRKGWAKLYRPAGYALDADGVLRKAL